jgi:FkbM family methyltransferase
MTASSGKASLRERAGAALGAVRSQLGRPIAQAENRPAGTPRAAGTDAAAETSTKAAVERDASDFGHIRRLLAFTLSDTSNCIDVGANHGLILTEVLRVAPHGRHIAFEPLPHLAKLLANSFPEVDVHQSALSNRAGEAPFSYVHGPSDGWSGLLFRPLPGAEQPEVEEITVRLEALDEVLDPEYHPALIKIDVEGAEQQVIEGALNTLRRHRPIVIFEHGLGSANAYGTTPADIYRLLCDEVGLRLFDLDGFGPYSLKKLETVYFSAERVNFVARP